MSRIACLGFAGILLVGATSESFSGNVNRADQLKRTGAQLRSSPSHTGVQSENALASVKTTQVENKSRVEDVFREIRRGFGNDASPSPSHRMNPAETGGGVFIPRSPSPLSSAPSAASPAMSSTPSATPAPTSVSSPSGSASPPSSLVNTALPPQSPQPTRAVAGGDPGGGGRAGGGSFGVREGNGTISDHPVGAGGRNVQ